MYKYLLSVDIIGMDLKECIAIRTLVAMAIVWEGIQMELLVELLGKCERGAAGINEQLQASKCTQMTQNPNVQYLDRKVNY